MKMLNLKALKITMKECKGKNVTKDYVQKYYLSTCERLKNEKKKH